MTILGLLVILFSMVSVLTIPAFSRTIVRRPKVHIGESAAFCQLYDHVNYNAEETNVHRTLVAEEEAFLHVACRTGHLVGSVDHAVGVDVSEEMVRCAKSVYPEKKFIKGDAMNDRLFDAQTFSCIGCFGNAIYSFPMKLKLTQNCHYWLKEGGKLLVQLNKQGRPQQVRKISGQMATVHLRHSNRHRYTLAGECIEVEEPVYPESTETVLNIIRLAGFELVRTVAIHDDCSVYVFVKRAF